MSLTLQQIIDRLKAEAPAFANRVHRASEIHELSDAASGTPLALVLHRPPQYQPNDGLGALISQPKRRRFAVIVRAYVSDDDESIVTASDEVDAALVGWGPDDSIQVTADAPEEQPPEGALMTWILNYSYQDYERHIR